MPKPNLPQIKPELKGDTQVITGIVRIAFANLLEPRANLSDPSKMQYSCTLLIEPNDPVVPLMHKAMKHAASERWGEKIPTGLRNPLRDGNTKPEYAGFEGHLFVNVTSKNRPGVVGLDPTKALTSEDEVYSGMWARVDINCFAYDQKGNKGVSFGLNNVQKLGDDERFSGRQTPDRVFTPVVDAASPFKAGDDDDGAGMFA